MTTLYYVIYPAALSAPSVAQIKAGQNTSGAAAAAFGSETARGTTGEQVFATAASSLDAGTSYKVAFVWSDGTNDSAPVVSEAWDTTALSIEGVLSVSLDAATLVSASAVEISGASSVSLEAAALVTESTVLVSGSSSVSLDPVTLVAAGEVALPGLNATVDVSLDDAVGTATGTVAVAVVLGSNLEDLTPVATGTVTLTGLLVTTLEDASLTSAGELGAPTAYVTGSMVLDPATVSAEALIAITDSVVAQLGVLTVSAIGTLEGAVIPSHNGVVNETLASAVVISAGTVAQATVDPEVPVEPVDPENPCDTGSCGASGACGTGLHILGPKPGDPDNNIFITANTVFGGINVAWAYPSVNGHAVSYFKLYRGTNADFDLAIELAPVTGALWYDRLNPPQDTEYFYWIRMVTVNGTVMPKVGPASAIARPMSKQTLEGLTGLIDAGVLAQSLKTEINKITLNKNDLLAEIAARIAGNAQLSAALALVQEGVEESIGLIHQESITRQSGQNALATQLSTVAAVNQANAAAIFSEQTARATADSALALKADELFAATDDNAAAVQDIQYAKIGYSVLSGAAQTPFDGNGSTIVYSSTKYPAAKFPEYAANRTRIIDKQGVINWNATPAGQSQPLTWVVGMPLASAVKTVQVTGPDGQQASVQQTFLAQKDLNNGFKALYTAKVQVNGLIGGFGIHNDGVIVDAGFDVDRFWIGRTGPDKVKPFIIDNGIVYINKARIRDADIDTLKIAGNAITVPMYDSAMVSRGHNGIGADLTTTPLVLCSLQVPIQGITSHEWVGTLVTGTVNFYDGGGSDANIVMELAVNGEILWESGITLGGSQTASATAMTYLPLGNHTIELRIHTSADIGAATKALYAHGSLVTMSGKR